MEENKIKNACKVTWPKSQETKVFKTELIRNFDTDCGWFVHSEYDEGISNSYWNATYFPSFFRGGRIPTCLEEFLPVISSRRSKVTHQIDVRDNFINRCFNVIVCRTLGQSQGIYPGIEYLQLSQSNIDFLISCDGIGRIISDKTKCEVSAGPNLYIDGKNTILWSSHFFVVYFPLYLKEVQEYLPLSMPKVLSELIHEYQNCDYLVGYADLNNEWGGKNIFSALEKVIKCQQ
jgi:hypothetical protein